MDKEIHIVIDDKRKEKRMCEYLKRDIRTKTKRGKTIIKSCSFRCDKKECIYLGADDVGCPIKYVMQYLREHKLVKDEDIVNFSSVEGRRMGLF